jgi:hypothetical protein
MPAEAARLTRSVGRRDRRLMAVLATGGVLLAGGGAAFALHTRDDASGERCVTVAAAGVMGGGDWRYCDPRTDLPGRQRIPSRARP